ncbi:hypothetical protein TNCV_2473541 [Trichonephila clavipes]|nr:hypothetical protein TNCV_2473541 [Trichonephila clavipes]
MRDSLVKTTSFYSAVHIFFHRTIGGGDVCGSAVKGRPSNERLAYRTLYYTCRRMVLAGTEWCITDSMCCATVPDVTERSVTAMRIIFLSSREVVH